jgi:hypothetical protein
MSANKDILDPSEQRTSDDVKKSTTPTVSSHVTSEEPKGGMGGYVVSVSNEFGGTPE